MSMTRWAIVVGAIAWCGAAAAAEVKVLTAGAFKPVVTALTADFERRTGHKLVVDNGTAGQLVKRISEGEAFDLAVITPGALDQIAKAEKLAAVPVTRVARVAIGVAVRQGAVAPDISSVDAFRKAVLGAKKVAYIDPKAGGSSGIYLANLFEKWGIAAQVNAKAVLVPGGLVAEKLVNGEADLALHQISEILAVPGARLVGPIPREIQNYTVYAGALSRNARDVAAAQAFLAELAGERGRAVLQEKGMEAP
jgi:molybdate transport system substrate-binding protein